MQTRFAIFAVAYSEYVTENDYKLGMENIITLLLNGPQWLSHYAAKLVFIIWKGFLGGVNDKR